VAARKSAAVLAPTILFTLLFGLDLLWRRIAAKLVLELVSLAFF